MAVTLPVVKELTMLVEEEEEVLVEEVDMQEVVLEEVLEIVVVEVILDGVEEEDTKLLKVSYIYSLIK